jgi:hypothetical protein
MEKTPELSPIETTAGVMNKAIHIYGPMPKPVTNYQTDNEVCRLNIQYPYSLVADT